MHKGLSWQLREATSRDAEFIFETLDGGIGPYIRASGRWDEAEERRNVDRFLESADVSIVQVAERDVGYLAVWRTSAEIYVASLALSPGHQRCGLGTALIRQLINEAESHSVPLRLSVTSNNPARRLYERLGFVVMQVDGPRLRMEHRPG